MDDNNQISQDDIENPITETPNNLSDQSQPDPQSLEPKIPTISKSRERKIILFVLMAFLCGVVALSVIFYSRGKNTNSTNTPTNSDSKPEATFKSTLFNYSNVGGYGDNLLAVSDGTNVGFVDLDGKIVIPMNLKYDNKGISFGSISAGLDEFYKFKDGLLVVKSDSKYGVIDKTGKLVVSYKYDYIDIYDSNTLIVELNEKYGMVDKNDNVILPLQYSHIQNVEGQILAMNDSGSGIVDNKGNTKYGFRKSFPLIMFDKINSKWAVVSNLGTSKYHISDENENTIFPEKYIDETHSQVNHYWYSNGYILIVAGTNFGLIDDQGNEVIKPTMEYDSIRPISVPSGLMAVTKGNQLGYINLKGELVVDLKYYTLSENFDKNQLAVVTTDSDVNSAKYGVIDTAGKEVLPFEYTKIIVLNKNRFLVTQDSISSYTNPKYSLIDAANTKINDNTYSIDYNDTSFILSGYIKVKTDAGWGMIDFEGKTIIKNQYNSMTLYEGLVLGEKVTPGYDVYKL